MVQTGSRTEQNRQNRFFRFRFQFQFSSAMGLSVRFLVLQKWLKNRTELNFGIANNNFGNREAGHLWVTFFGLVLWIASFVILSVHKR